MRMLLSTLFVVLSASALAGPEHAHTMGEDRFAAGEEVTSRTPVAGDLIMAGGRVRVDAPVGGDLVAAGGNVRIDAATDQDLYAAGGRVALDGRVGGNARIAGGDVDIGRGAGIAGNATVAAGEVLLAGEVGGHLSVAGGEVFLNGRVAGDVEATAGEIELGPDARIAGNLRYRSDEPLMRSPTAEVQGSVVHLPAPPPWENGAEAGMRVVATFLLLWTLGLTILAAIVAALPRLSAGLEQAARSRPGMSLLAGLAVLVATPIVAAILLASGIGLPIGLVLLGAYLAALILGYAGAGAALGRMALRRFRPAGLERKGTRAVAGGVAMLLVSLVAAIPFLGWLAVLAAWLAGIGALLLQWRAQPAAAAP